MARRTQMPQADILHAHRGRSSFFAVFACMVNEIFPGLTVFKTSLVHLATLAALSSVSVAAMACEQVRMEPGSVVTSVVDGDTVILDDGRVVRMIGTQAPKLPLDRPDF